MKSLMYEHTAIDNSLAMRWWLGQFVVNNWHVVWHLVVGLLQIHLAGEFLTNLIKGLCGPVSKPIQHTPNTEESFLPFSAVSHFYYAKYSSTMSLCTC